MTTNFSAKQKELIAQLKTHLDIDPKEISLDENGELFFSLDALNLLTIRLAPDIQALSVSAHSYETEIGIVNAYASITLTDGRLRSCVKGAQIDEPLPNGKIETLIQAANIADGRAARACLRAVGFDPIREFDAFLHAKPAARELADLSQAEKDRRYIHKVRDDLDLDENTYRQHLSTVTLGQATTTEGMSEAQLSMCAVFFRGLATANEMSRRKAA